MHEMQTVVTDVRGVRLFISLSVMRLNRLGFTVRRSFGAVFAKLLWPLVIIN